MQDRPTAGELLRAARDFCERDLMPELTGRLRFHTRVLVNVLGILEREWEGEEDAVRAEWERLRVLLGSDAENAPTFKEASAQVREWNADLGARIRSGDMGDRWEELLSALRQTVAEKLAIASPRHSEGASSTT